MVTRRALIMLYWASRKGDPESRSIETMALADFWGWVGIMGNPFCSTLIVATWGEAVFNKIQLRTADAYVR